MTKFIVNNRTDAWKSDVHLFFTTINCQMVRSRSLLHRINYKFMCLSAYWQRKLVWQLFLVSKKPFPKPFKLSHCSKLRSCVRWMVWFTYPVCWKQERTVFELMRKYLRRKVAHLELHYSECKDVKDIKVVLWRKSYLSYRSHVET